MRVSRITLCVAVMCAVMMLGFPSFVNDGEPLSAVDSVAALPDVDRLFSIGTSDMTVSTLNPFQYTMSDEYLVIWLCMSTLLTYDLDLQLQGDLAKSWETSDDGLTWTFEIVDNAYFCDPADPTNEVSERLVTVEDVIYTYWAVQNFKSNLHFYLPGGSADGPDVPPTIASMTADGQFKMTIVLDHPFAPFIGALSTVPIIPKYYWEDHEGGSGDPTGWTQALPLGSGAFYYPLDGLPTAGEAPLYRNPSWFQEKNRGWQIHVDTLKLKDMTDSSTAWTELKLGNIDCMMGVQPAVYTGELETLTDVIGFAQSTGFVYEFNLNQLTEEKRDELGWTGGPDAYNNPILLDPVVKEAMAMCIDKYAFIDDVLEGLGTYADSLIPDVNPWYHRYENPVTFDTAAARQMLMDAGWNMDAAGNPASPTETPLYGYFEGELEPLDFRFVTLNDPPEWLTGATLIKDWCAEAGVQLNLELVSPNQMNTIWYYGSYDTWLWDWIFTPLSEPSTDILSVLTTDEIGTWSDVFMSEPVFDALYNESVRAMDPAARRAILDEMQDFAYEHYSLQCIAYRKELYAVSTLNWNNYGDWEDKFMLMPDQGLPYVYMMMSPSGPAADDHPNQAPVITSLDAEFEGYVETAISFSGSATDGSTLQYQWYWGDGETSGWLSSPSATHTYDRDGYYTVYFAARESDDDTTADYFITWGVTTAKVVDASNTAPHDLSIDFDPLMFDIGDVVTFTGSAIDDEDDDLDYSWAFGDMYSAKGPVVEHQYQASGSYTVTLSVTDNRVGTDPRPVTTNALAIAGGNSPPTIDVPDFSDVATHLSYDFSVTASDPNDDPIRYTWDWGDGTQTVTDTDSVSHTYDVQGFYDLTVYADDQTGVDGHNVSDTGAVTVMSEDNTAPVVVSFIASDTTPYTGQEITFTAVATDADYDSMRLTFALGDGTYAVEESEPTSPDEEVSFTVSHTYDTAGTVTAYVYVWDYQDNTSSSAVSITVEANAAPLVPDLPYPTVMANTTVVFTTEPFDPDGDDLSSWWDFGDDSPMESGDTVTHMYVMPGEYVYRVYVDDAHEHNETKSGIITVLSEDANFAPEVDALANMTALVGEIVVFNATATDVNEDVLIYTWDFGDDSDLVVGQEVDHVYSAADNHTFTVYVDDGEFNESADAVITVSASEPPVANAGDDQTVDVGVEVAFDGSGSTDDVGIVNYTWTLEYDGGTITLYGVAPAHMFEVAGEYNVTLTVNDFEGQTDADYVTITVEDDKTFIEGYGLVIGLVALLVVVAVVYIVLKGRKGGKTPSSSEIEGVASSDAPEEPGPPPPG
ncbi:MAG: PKD domain-containing protein [Thermoplasmata archaeon]|nr:PKD domain-containing protein [Thermoplasmata archaeon]TFG70852.1 MAG: PKD domain-containing protein [Methanomassiliicoccus sp.]